MALTQLLSRRPAQAAVLQKEAMKRAGSYLSTVYMVNEHPKSGATWLKFMLADALGLPAWTKDNPQYRRMVMQDCLLRPVGGCRMITLFRDGRDVMVSFYHHALLKNEFQNTALNERMRRRFQFDDYTDVRTNLLAFMKGAMETPISHGFNWVDFVRSWAPREDVPCVTYDALRRDAAGELVRLVHELTGQDLDPARAAEIEAAHSMANMRKRKASMGGLTGADGTKAETSFIREGSVGGWSRFFTDEALDWFEAHAGEELKMLGYTLGRPASPTADAPRPE